MIQFILSDKHLDGAGQSLKHFLDKIKYWHFHSTSIEVIWPQKFKFHARIKTCHFGNFTERAEIAVLVRPSRIPHRISKIIFVLGFYELLAMLEGKIRETPFF